MEEERRLFHLEGMSNDYLVQVSDQYRAGQELKHVAEGIALMSFNY